MRLIRLSDMSWQMTKVAQVSSFGEPDRFSAQIIALCAALVFEAINSTGREWKWSESAVCG